MPQEMRREKREGKAKEKPFRRNAPLALARASDLIASVPERQTGNLRAGIYGFPLPFPAPEVAISLLWHPRLDADPAHRWLRGLVLDTCAAIR